jgi:putative ABC transport system ATP-binding protein
MLMCDEPTGALDSVTSKDILILTEKINRQYGTTVMMVTHNNAIKDMADRVIRVSDGLIAENYINKDRVPAEKLEGL